MAAAQTTYDTKNQLLSEQSTRAGGYTFSFAYDPAQNPTTFKGQTRVYNANNQLIGTGFAYDGNGNPVLYKGVNLAFDPENRMTAYGNILTAGYNGDGLRAWKQTASGRRYYLYDGEELVCELDATGNVATPVVFGANGLVVYSGHIYQFDPQGNAVHLLDDDGRTVLANLAYDAWGQLISGYNPTPYGYKAQWGYYTDVETGILLLTHRYSDPATGRFLTRDPIGFEGGVNLYAYVGNGVVMRADPSGLFLISPEPSGCVVLPDGTCIGLQCMYDVRCIGQRPIPPPSPPRIPIPKPSPGPCYRNPLPGDLPPGCFMMGGIKICQPIDCLKNFHPRLGPWMKARCKDCCKTGKLFGWSRHDVNRCNIWCDTY